MAARDAPHVAIDGRHPGLDAVRRDVVKEDGITGERTYMRDSVAHLAGANYPDTLNFDHVFVRSMRSPGFALEFGNSRV